MSPKSLRGLRRGSARRPLRLGLLLLFFGILVAIPYLLPWVFPDMQTNPLLLRRWLDILVAANLLAILAMSWDLLGGYAGQISFGHSFFFGLGAFTAAILSLSVGWNPWVIIVVGAVIAAVGGVLIAAPALRLHGPYLSLLTLVAALAFDRFIRWLKPADRFDLGIPGAEGAILCSLKCFLTFNAVTKYYYALALLVGSFGVMWAIARSRIGLALEAIRDDEEAAQAAGINTAKFKTLAFGVSGFFAGLSGAFYVYHIGSASPSYVLNLERSVEAIATAVLGGMGTIVGPIFGAYFFKLFEELFRPLGELRFGVLFSLALLVLLLIQGGLLAKLQARLRPARTVPSPSAPAETKTKTTKTEMEAEAATPPPPPAPASASASASASPADEASPGRETGTGKGKGTETEAAQR